MSDLETKLKNNVHRWLTPKAEAFSSPKHGRGIRIVEPIKQGENVLVYGGVILHMSQMKEYWNKMGHIGTQIDDDFFIVPSSQKEIEGTGTINHSCNPNTGFKNQIQLVAIRDIKVGDELTLDYALCESSHPMNFECKCGSKNCRGTVTNNDWKIPELHQRYGNSFSPYLVKKYKELH